MNYDYVIQASSTTKSSSSSIPSIHYKTSTTHQNNRFIDSLLRIFLPNNASKPSPPLRQKSFQFNNNRLMSINKIFSRSYVKSSSKSTGKSNYKLSFAAAESTKSTISSSKDLSWYRLEELDPYYQVLGIFFFFFFV